MSCYRKDDYNWRYDGDELPEDVVRASTALENLQLDRKARNLTSSWRLVPGSMQLKYIFVFLYSGINTQISDILVDYPEIYFFIFIADVFFKLINFFCLAVLNKNVRLMCKTVLFQKPFLGGLKTKASTSEIGPLLLLRKRLLIGREEITAGL